MKINSWYYIIIITLVTSCGIKKKQNETLVVDRTELEQVHFAQSYYDTYSLNKYPPHQYRYYIGVKSGKEPSFALDSVVWVKAGDDKIGTRTKIGQSWLFWEDLNQCNNLGIFDNKASVGNKAGVLPAELNFSNFPELRHFRSHSVISEKHLGEVLQTAKKLKGLEIYLDKDLPDEICDCKELESLKIFSFAEVNLPPCIKNLPKLKYLAIVGVSGNVNDIIWEIPSLEALYIEGGEYLNIPRSIKTLKRLKHIKLSYLDSLSIPNEFNELDSLELLELFRIDKKINYLGQFENLNELRALKMGDLGLSNFPLLRESKKLLYLTAENIHELDSVDLDFINLTLLHTLKLSGKAFNEIDEFPKGIDSVKNLQTLHLRDFSITEIPLYFNHFVGLKDLNLVGRQGVNLSYSSLKMVYDFNGSIRQRGLGLRYFQARQGGMTKLQRIEIQTLKNVGGISEGRYLDKFLPTFDYYLFKLKYYQEKYRGY